MTLHMGVTDGLLVWQDGAELDDNEPLLILDYHPNDNKIIRVADFDIDGKASNVHDFVSLRQALLYYATLLPDKGV